VIPPPASSLADPRPRHVGARAPREGAHDVVRVWNRGGLAGELIVNEGDGEKIAARLLPEPAHVERGRRFAIFYAVYP
jgi:hypothetical protein